MLRIRNIGRDMLRNVGQFRERGKQYSKDPKPGELAMSRVNPE